MQQLCEAAPAADQIKASYVAGSLWIVARGSCLSSCWDVSLERSPIAVFPPEFSLEACRSARPCLEVVTPYFVRRQFPMATDPKSVVVHDAAGPHNVKVEVVPDLAVQSTKPGEATGTSLTLSLGEALGRAASQLEPGPGDTGHDVKVEEISYTDGGIVGPALHVRVSDRRSG